MCQKLCGEGSGGVHDEWEVCGGGGGVRDKCVQVKEVRPMAVLLPQYECNKFVRATARREVVGANGAGEATRYYRTCCVE